MRVLVARQCGDAPASMGLQRDAGSSAEAQADASRALGAAAGTCSLLPLACPTLPWPLLSAQATHAWLKIERHRPLRPPPHLPAQVAIDYNAGLTAALQALLTFTVA
jgi:hypothetical protein